MIYFDNSATSGIKPQTVITNLINIIKSPSFNVGRGNFKEQILAEENIFLCRELLSKHVNNGLIGKLLFTSGCTESLNFLILGTPILGTNIVTSVTEHNSVLRPLYNLKKRYNIELRFAQISDLKVSKNNVLNLVDEKTCFVILNAVSNVTGVKNEFEDIGRSLGNIPFFVDGAQAGGHLNIDMTKSNISGLAFSGHKGFFSLPGVGVLALKKDFELNATFFGGTGTESFNEFITAYPEKFEVGTQNYPSIMSLYHGAKWAISNLNEHNIYIKSLVNRLIGGLLTISTVKVFSRENIFGIVSFSANNVDSQRLQWVLGSKFNIVTRGGYHCAPLMHKALNTQENGLLRVSLSPFNTQSEVDYFLDILPDAIKLSK